MAAVVTSIAQVFTNKVEAVECFFVYIHNKYIFHAEPQSTQSFILICLFCLTSLSFHCSFVTPRESFFSRRGAECAEILFMIFHLMNLPFSLRSLRLCERVYFVEVQSTQSYKLFTILVRPSFNSTSLKLISNPSFIPDNFKYVSNCFL